MMSRFLAAQALKRVSGGKLNRPNKMQALMRLPTLLKLGYALMRDTRVPSWQRAGAVGLIGLILSPLDVVGDIPVVGQFWDFTLAVVVLDAFIQKAPAAVVNEHIIRLGLQDKVPLRDL
ncbi:MAG: YkvA family protein [Chloroflexota bacterium]